jgi:hypothetical protein
MSEAYMRCVDFCMTMPKRVRFVPAFEFPVSIVVYFVNLVALTLRKNQHLLPLSQLPLVSAPDGIHDHLSSIIRFPLHEAES